MTSLKFRTSVRQGDREWGSLQFCFIIMMKEMCCTYEYWDDVNYCTTTYVLCMYIITYVTRPVRYDVRFLLLILVK